MKIIHLFLLIFCLSLSVQSFGQKTKKGKKVNAIKLKKKHAKNYLNGILIQGFSVDKDGVIRPAKGYEVVIIESTKQFVVKPETVEYDVSNDNVIVIKLDDGATMICACGFGEGDDCSVNMSEDGNDIVYKCVGNCSCGSIFIEPTLKIAQYETMEGNWNSF